MRFIFHKTYYCLITYNFNVAETADVTTVKDIPSDSATIVATTLAPSFLAYVFHLLNNKIYIFKTFFI